MSSQSRFDFVAFFERWSKLAGLLGGIASAIAFASESFWLSIAMVLVGWVLISSWLVGVIMRRRAETDLALPGAVKRPSKKPFYPNWVRASAAVALILLTVATGIWSWIGIIAQIATLLPPTNAVKLPAASSTDLSMIVEPGQFWFRVGVITENIDHSVVSQTINSRAILLPWGDSGDLCPRFIRPDWLPTIHIILTGKAAEEPVQISNRVPVKVISYQPIADEVDVVASETGGGEDVWLLSLELSGRIASHPDQIVWATYTSDLRSRLTEAQAEGTIGFDVLPSEVQKAISSGTRPLPDYFLLKYNERVVLSIATSFQEPGIYWLQFGVEYLYRGYRAIAWAEPPIEVHVLKDYYLWYATFDSVEGKSHCLLSEICRLHPTSSEYQCLAMHWSDYLAGGNIAFSPDGKMLASGRSGGPIRLWDVATGEELHTLSGHTNRINSVAFSPDGKVLAWASRAEVRLYDVATGMELRTLSGHTNWINSVAFSSDGKMLASASETVKLWDAATGKELHTLSGHTWRINSVAFSPDGKVLASASETVKLWDVATGEELRTLSGHISGVNSVAFSPDGKMLASASETVKLWDVATGEELHTLSGHISRVNSVAFSPDGKMLASASEAVKLWDVATGKELHTFSGHISWVNSVTFSPDGEMLASASETLKLWDVATDMELRTLSLP